MLAKDAEATPERTDAARGGDVTERLKLLAVLAHPDDESLAAGSTLAHYAAEGVRVHLVTATRGERGRWFDGTDRPSDGEVGVRREAELHAAASDLGIEQVRVLGYPDGGLDGVDHRQVTAGIVDEIRSFAPHVVLTFDPFGAYGHPDHIAISQLTTAATVAAADPRFGDGNEATPHRVSKLYYLAEDASSWGAFEAAFDRRLALKVDGGEREATGWPAWAVTTRIDTGDAWRIAWRAIRRHETQMAIYSSLGQLSDEELAGIWRRKGFYRAFSLVNGGRALETDLFSGLRRDHTVGPPEV